MRWQGQLNENAVHRRVFVQLLDQKVLDPRLMVKLLRYQATMLIRIAFTRDLKVFRFESGSFGNALHKTLPLDISLLATLDFHAGGCSPAVGRWSRV